MISGHLEKAMRARMAAGEPVNPQDSEWLREVLKDCPLPQSEVDAYLDLMAFQATVAPVMMRVTQKLLARSFPEGIPTLEGPEVRKALEEDGTLTAAQIDRLLNDITGPFAKSEPPRNGGRVVAYDDVSGEELWQLEVYRDDSVGGSGAQDIFITEMRVKGEDLVVSDEAGREHRIDLRARRSAGQ